MSKKQNAEEDYITTPISVLAYITDLERQLEQKRKIIESCDEELEQERKEKNKLAIANRVLERQLEEARSLYKHSIDSLNFIHQFSECDRSRDCAKIELDRFMGSNLNKLKGQEDE